MTGKERFLTALMCGEPDRVPIWELAINEPCIINIARLFTENVPPVKFLHEMTPSDIVAIFNMLKLIVEENDMDGVTVPTLQGREMISDSLVRDHMGIISLITPHGEPMPVEGPINSMAEADAYRPPKVDETWAFGTKIANAQFGEKRAVVMMLPDPFKVAWALRGKMENTLIGYIDEPELSHRVARIALNICIDSYHQGRAAGADAYALAGDLAMNERTMMSPKQFREYIKPYYRELVDIIHNHDDMVLKHSDGNLWAIMDDLLEIGFDGIHPIQPQCMDIAETKAKIGGRACVLGNIDCVDLLVSGSEEEVEREVERTIKIAAPGGGYILSSSNTIHSDVKPENAVAMWRAAKKHGKYPV